MGPPAPTDNGASCYTAGTRNSALLRPGQDPLPSMDVVELLMPETLLRAVVFTVLLVLLMVSERLAPRRPHRGPTALRWFSNLSLGTINILLLRFGFPFFGFALAVVTVERGWGLLQQLAAPAWLAFVLSLLLLDLLIWAQHRFLHWHPFFWRLHRMHHADMDFDATTAVRFHPLEAIFSMLIKSAAIVLLGIPPMAFLAFEIVLSSTSLFNHGNVRLPERLDRLLRWFIVTPDMHRIHHSMTPAETDSNFGFNLPWWDRLFGTYRADPALPHPSMEIGIRGLSERDDQRLDRLLLQPLRQL